MSGSSNGVGIAFLFSPISLQSHARGGAESGRYRRKYRDDEVDDFLPKFFLVHDCSCFKCVINDVCCDSSEFR
jgi:hypothetical protein